MNLMFLNSIDAEVYGGLEHWIGMVASGLTERGHRVSAVGRPGSEYLRRTNLMAPETTGVELAISGDFNPLSIMALKKLMEQQSLDAVICNFNKDVRLGGLAAFWRGGTKVIWGMGSNLARRKWIHRALTPRLLDGAITPSLALKQQVLRPGYLRPDMIRVIPIGIKEARQWQPGKAARQALRLKYGLAAGSLVAVTSGRFVQQKGHTFLVEAALDIVKQHPDISFLWLGDGQLQESLQAQISEGGLADRFIFAGLLDDFELEMAGADLMIHPATIEPFGIVLLEGMRAGLPIVASRVGGIPEVVAEGETARLVPPADPQALAAAVTALLADQEVLAAYGQAGYRRWKAEFAYDVMIERVESYLQTVVDSRAEAAC